MSHALFTVLGVPVNKTWSPPLKTPPLSGENLNPHTQQSALGELCQAQESKRVNTLWDDSEDGVPLSLG